MNEPNVDPQVDYPLGVHRKDLLFTPTGKSVDEMTIEAVVSGKVTAEDLRITPDTLRLQAQISEKVGRVQLGANLRRAAEMTSISDEARSGEAFELRQLSRVTAAAAPLAVVHAARRASRKDFMRGRRIRGRRVGVINFS